MKPTYGASPRPEPELGLEGSIARDRREAAERARREATPPDGQKGELTLTRKSPTVMDDEDTGRFTWRVEFICVRCCCEAVETASGTRDDVEEFHASRLCFICRT